MIDRVVCRELCDKLCRGVSVREEPWNKQLTEEQATLVALRRPHLPRSLSSQVISTGGSTGLANEKPTIEPEIGLMLEST
jgi:hypothetical protein